LQNAFGFFGPSCKLRRPGAGHQKIPCQFTGILRFRPGNVAGMKQAKQGSGRRTSFGKSLKATGKKDDHRLPPNFKQLNLNFMAKSIHPNLIGEKDELTTAQSLTSFWEHWFETQLQKQQQLGRDLDEHGIWEKAIHFGILTSKVTND
jgi:hypothetical protein